MPSTRERKQGVGGVRAEIHIYGADYETGELVAFKEDGTKVWLVGQLA